MYKNNVQVSGYCVCTYSESDKTWLVINSYYSKKKPIPIWVSIPSHLWKNFRTEYPNNNLIIVNGILHSDSYRTANSQYNYYVEATFVRCYHENECNVMFKGIGMVLDNVLIPTSSGIAIRSLKLKTSNNSILEVRAIRQKETSMLQFEIGDKIPIAATMYSNLQNGNCQIFWRFSLVETLVLRYRISN